jgi:hypothetical protein
VRLKLQLSIPSSHLALLNKVTIYHLNLIAILAIHGSYLKLDLMFVATTISILDPLLVQTSAVVTVSVLDLPLVQTSMVVGIDLNVPLVLLLQQLVILLDSCQTVETVSS